MGEPILLFDLGGVLIENDMFTELRRLTGAGADESELLERWLAEPAARRFERGHCDPDTFASDIVAAFDLPLAPRVFLDQFARWPKGFSRDVVDMLSWLRQRYRIGCLSNSNSVHWHAGLTEPFDFAYSSHLIGHVKPDTEAFLHVIEQEALHGERVYYFDDAASNVATARSCGLDAHQTLGAEALKRTLASKGIFV